MIDPVIELSLRLALALLFAAAAWHKVSDRIRFGATLRAYQLLPSWSLAPFTWLLSTAEALIALGLLLPSTRQAAAFGAGALLLLYAGAIGMNLIRGRRDIDCGCFASSARVPLSNWLVARNAILIVAACLLVLPVRPRSLIWIDALTIATAVITLSLLWAAGQRLANTGPALRRVGGTP
jgi:uncharacterized membrane protein